MSVSVCLSVCLLVRISGKPHVQSSPDCRCALALAVTRFCSGDFGIYNEKVQLLGATLHYVHPVLWMRCLLVIVQANATQVRRLLRVTHRGKQGFDNTACTPTDSSGPAVDSERYEYRTIAFFGKRD